MSYKLHRERSSTAPGTFFFCLSCWYHWGGGWKLTVPEMSKVGTEYDRTDTTYPGGGPPKPGGGGKGIPGGIPGGRKPGGGPPGIPGGIPPKPIGGGIGAPTVRKSSCQHFYSNHTRFTTYSAASYQCHDQQAYHVQDQQEAEQGWLCK
jgi:hypothetical protein